MSRSSNYPTTGKAVRSFVAKQKRRHKMDQFAAGLISAGGVGVIATILLIFVYLLIEILPLFRSVSTDLEAQYRFEEFNSSRALHWAVHEIGDAAVRIDDGAVVSFIDLRNGTVISKVQLALPDGVGISAFAADSQESGLFALGLNDGSVLIAQYNWNLEFDNDVRNSGVNPSVQIAQSGRYELDFENPIHSLSIQSSGSSLIIAAVDSLAQLNLVQSDVSRSLLDDFESDVNFLGPIVDQRILSVSLGSQTTAKVGENGRFLFLVDENTTANVVDVRSSLENQQLNIIASSPLSGADSEVTSIEFLSGGLSLLVGTDLGEISQWFLVKENDQIDLTSVRRFDAGPDAVSLLAVESRRKNFLVSDELGGLSLFNTTSQRKLYQQNASIETLAAVAIFPRGNGFLLENTEGVIEAWSLVNQHPEISFAALWDKVWYENYDEAEFVWQTSAASNQYEPKYSLTPLSFGTLKAAFYAMLLAAPLAICAAIYTGYFIAPTLRRKVKPIIELMEALPTVVLGFLAGLWLAPLIDSNLIAVISVFFITPLFVILLSMGWFFLPRSIRYRVPDGWEAVLLVPGILLAVSVAFTVAGPLESYFFAGNLQQWMSQEFDIGYDQRNAMVVGIAMGFAVIPSIYSISEDAVFSVPRHLSDGSLALGSTAWQSLYYVVLPMASPGIFSALMIGLGRAVGETMIVLMATGNTPIIDVNIFEGLRTLAASIAIEVPESEVGSTHYRILFLAAFCLFLFTFIINTIAEVVRQRLRKRYSNI